MTLPKTEYFVQVQRHKTIRYGSTQYYEDYVTIPAHISKALELEPKQVLKCILNGNGTSFVMVKASEKPALNKMRYEEWLDRIRKHAPPVTGPWKAYAQIRREGGISLAAAPSVWVKLAEKEIGLKRARDPHSHQMMWALDNHEEFSALTEHSQDSHIRSGDPPTATDKQITLLSFDQAATKRIQSEQSSRGNRTAQRRR